MGGFVTKGPTLSSFRANSLLYKEMEGASKPAKPKLFEIVLKDIKKDYNALSVGILNLKEYENHIIGSKTTAILLNLWILPIDEVAAVRVFAQP